jgi:branched-chain amino acid aminotransferase
MLTSVTYLDGAWHEGNVPLLGSMDHAVWLSSVVFDGARSFGGMAPDLDRHCERVVDSARKLGLEPSLEPEQIEAIAWEGIRRFPREAVLYVRPMFFATDGFVVPEASSTRFALVVHDLPFPTTPGFTACLSSTRRPAGDSAPTDAKASCLYPNVARTLREAQARGFDNAVVLDQAGDVAEFAVSNLFLVQDGVVHTPVPNGTFLAGVTRRRVIELLRLDGVEVVERRVGFDEVLAADEVFSTGNYAKVAPALRIEDRELEPGPLFSRVRELYLDFARSAHGVV